MLNVQASVALHLAKNTTDPRLMYEALENIKAGSRETLQEVREVPAVLRQDAPRVPSQSLEQLDELIQRVRGAKSVDRLRERVDHPGALPKLQSPRRNLD